MERKTHICLVGDVSVKHLSPITIFQQLSMNHYSVAWEAVGVTAATRVRAAWVEASHLGATEVLRESRPAGRRRN
jgi:hypothetical protein